MGLRSSSSASPAAQNELSSPSPSNGSERQSVVLSAVVFAIGILSSRVLGLIRDMMTARYFPVEIRDAFLVAFRLPNVFRRIFGEGAFGVSLIPVLIEVMTGKGESGDEAARRARQLVSSVFSIVLSITIVLSLLGIVFMDRILGVLVSGEGYMSVPGKFELTVRLARIMFGFLVLISTYAFFMSVLNSVKKFAVAAFAPCLFNLALISAAKVSSRFAASEEVLAWSVIVGGFVQMVVLVPAVMRAGLLPRPTFRLSAESLRVLKMLVPGILGMSVMHLSTLVSLHFASQLSQGTHSYIYFADRIFELPLSLFVVSVGSALLPTLASQWARGAREQMADTINHTMRLIVFVSLPAALGMFTLAQPICEVLFLGREFKYQDAVATAQVIQVYSFGLVLSAGVRILAQGFFAIGNTWFPAVAAGVALLSHVLFAWALTGAFGLVGLVASAVLSAAVNVTMLAAAYNSWVGSLELKRLFVSFLKFSVCGAAMVGSLMIYPTLKHAIRGGTAVNSFTLCLTISIGIFVYMLAAHVLRLPEYRETASAFAAKARAKLGRK